ncbi:hypothetical protein K469DRAFT_673661 [Zopfia rhizophila CBS 207.26]|uniref:Chromo domain-containing protein n=1 Tax=Zopfia rhizophila CBS 207.26 TaxID=1314779 RepID=A0A6A6DK06_9PEZI|nr:hypothetical protein K469DRAFT_673661 [Zopfia rhizophila CBS 207.26]
MAPSSTRNLKRKRQTNATAKQKRSRFDEPSPDPEHRTKEGEGEGSQQDYWKANCILQETKTKYLIEWAGVDPSTRKPYEPTWEPKANANNDLKEEWKQKKSAKKAAARATPKKSAQKSVGRKAKEVKSSSIPSTPAPSAPNGAFVNETPLSTEPSTNTSPIAPPPQPGRAALYVQVEPPSDFDPADYERFSQLPLTQPSSQPDPQSSALHVEDPNSSLTHNSPTPAFVSTGIVPDSQSLPGSSSYIPSTQAASGSNQRQSLTTTNGTNEASDTNKEDNSASAVSAAERSPSASSPAPVPETDPIENTDSSSQPEVHTSEDTSAGAVAEHFSPAPLSHQTVERSHSTPPREASLGAVAEANTALQNITQEESISRRDFAQISQGETVNPVATPEFQQSNHLQSAGPQSTQQEQHAQVVPEDSYLSTQDEFSESIRPTTEVFEAYQDIKRHNSVPENGTDSSRSRQNPSHSLISAGIRPNSQSVDHSLPPPRGPSHSLGTMDSNAPPRPQNPVNFSSLSAMNVRESNDAEEFGALFDAHVAKARAESAFAPSRRVLLTQSPAGASTRSPSTIPDRVPQQQVPTSLRTTALINSTTAEAAPPVTSPLVNLSVPADNVSDVDDTASLLNDDLQLLPEEYIVPLSMEGRQKSMYINQIRREEELLKNFLEEPDGFGQVPELNEQLQKLKAIETHIDLLISETEISSQVTGALTQAMWDLENCVKFRFLAALIDSLRKSEMHLLVVLEKEGRIFDILEKFFQGKYLNYSYPAKGRKANLSDVEGSLTITVLAHDSSPVVRPPNAILCLDGTLDSAQIRKQKWAVNPGGPAVPIIHLVIPRSVGHIERYIPSTLKSTKRLHTIFASLSQISSEIGRAMVETPSAPESAELVANFVTTYEENDGQAEWPLPSIGSIKEVIDYQSQQSQFSVGSPVHASTPFSKRPLDVEEHLDPAKRIRMTPQPQASGTVADSTHISDSIPGSSQKISKLQALLEETQQALKQKEAAFKASERHSRQFEATLNRRQTEFEDLTRRCLMLQEQLETANTRVERADKEKVIKQEQYERKCAEVQEVKAQLEQQQQTNLASDDEKVAEITQLRLDLAACKLTEEKATKLAKSTEETLGYVREQYQNAQSIAAEYAQANQLLQSQVAKLEKKASGEAARLKQIHLEKNHETMVKMNDQLKIRKGHLERLLERKEDEISRYKNGKGVGMGTRAASVPRSPRVGGASGSRAASPVVGGRDRVRDLRNG